jgi:hypothetical protein
MKKVFLFFGIASFSSASAQQKDVFDINRHIQEVLKNKNPSGTGVKTFINPLTESQPKLSYLLSNGDKLYILNQDNMPCVVPDISQFNMPNISNPDEYFESTLFRNHLPGSIPNAVKPDRLITSK